MSDSFATPWIVAHQAFLSMGLPRQEYWNGLPFPSHIYISIYDIYIYGLPRWTEEPGGPQGHKRFGHNLVTKQQQQDIYKKNNSNTEKTSNSEKTI